MNTSVPPRREGVNPYVFVVGCPRSGTTLLQRMLDAHPDLAIANDTHFIPRALGNDDGSDLSAPVIDRVVSYKRFARLGIDEVTARQLGAGATTYSQYVSRLYDELATRRGKPYAGEKTPDYVRHLSLLSQLFPQAKVVHIIRDGRDVALSALEWAGPTKGPGRFDLWRTEPVVVSALWWARFVIAGRHDGADLGPRLYHEISYETLVEDPEPVLRSVATFLGLEFHEGMLRFNAGRERDDPRLSAKSAWRPPTPGLRNWKQTMDSRGIEIFDGLVGPLLEELGYERLRSGGTSLTERQLDAWRAQWLAEVSKREGADAAALAAVDPGPT